MLLLPLAVTRTNLIQYLRNGRVIRLPRSKISKFQSLLNLINLRPAFPIAHLLFQSNNALQMKLRYTYLLHFLTFKERILGGVDLMNS